MDMLVADPLSLFLAAAAVAVAYAVFTLVGFGSALVASGPLAMVMAPSRVIPLLALLDFFGAATRGWRARRDVAWTEFRHLFPGMLAGQCLGITVLARAGTAFTLAALGLFVAGQGLRGLLARPGNTARAPRWPFLHGLFGGLLGGLFGSGGFVYAAWLERRLENRSAFRATQAVLIALSTVWRIVLCLSLGLLDARLLLTALCFVPAVLLGVLAGRRIDLRLGRAQLFAVLNVLLVASGVGLLARAVG
ncbi:TSUP family transporter [uncultured Massilia sp.]|uniref:TSUP family transporter n=1 Tax=uncultured Massilia sp. TaxID=169973 RepID=UPI0025EB1915|nr:TSUP family transporter [uncultured Massilia sp.]